jgi:hypothetical protein
MKKPLLPLQKLPPPRKLQKRKPQRKRKLLPKLRRRS